MTPRARSFLICPECRSDLAEPGLTCRKCGTVYQRTGERPSFLTFADQSALEAALDSDKENRVKNFFKRWPRVYDRAALIISPILFTGLTGERFVRRFTSNEIILNVGSGPTSIHLAAVNVDVYPFQNVDILAKAERLPFRDEVFDGVCCDQVLEHVEDPARVLTEIHRVTKKGGLIYLGVPFMFPLHPSPKDYARWSMDGVCTLLRGCEILERNVSMGPTSGMLTVLTAWLSIFFSFGLKPLQRPLQYFFMLLLNPLKLLDLVYARLPGAQIIPAGVYVIAKKL